MKQAETHGMSQRGGDVQSFMRISDRPIHSDLIAKGSADLILSVEPMEALRYLPYLRSGGYVVTNATPLVNIPNYPDLPTLMATLDALPHRIVLDADKIAEAAAGNSRAGNLVMLGAASPFIDIPFEYLAEESVPSSNRKGENVVAMNLKALQAGREFAQHQQSVSY